MNNKLIVGILLICMNSLIAQTDDLLKWAWEDQNADGVWNYSVTNWNFVSANEWDNFGMSTDAYAGETSMRFEYLNEDIDNGSSYTQAYGFATIPTAYGNTGFEPTHWDEYVAGKNLTEYTYIEFYIKGDIRANQAALEINMNSNNGHNSKAINLIEYVTINNEWQKVRIPVEEFIPDYNTVDRFQLFNVHTVNFHVDQYDYNVPFVIYVDNMSFVKEKGVSMPYTRVWWKRDANDNGEYNYSTTHMNGGSTINVSNQWGDAVIGSFLTGPYGQTEYKAIDVQFNHNGSGYAEASLTTAVSNTGDEPFNFYDRDAGKAVSNTATNLTFGAPSHGDGIKVKLLDKYGNISHSVSIETYRSSYGRYAFTYTIPTTVFDGTNLNWDNVVSVVFFVDNTVAAGNYEARIFDLTFKRE